MERIFDVTPAFLEIRDVSKTFFPVHGDPVDALASNGMDEIEIPAFLRKQAD